MPMLGNNTKRGGDPRWDKYVLQELNKIAAKTTGTETSTVNLETLLQSVLSLLESRRQDMEIILVKWTNNSVSSILKEISTYTTGDVLQRKYYDATGTNVTEEVESSISAGTGSISHIDVSALIQELIVMMHSKQAVTHTIASSTTGTVPTNVGGSVFNLGDADGTWNGVTLKQGVSMSWGSDGNNLFDAIVFNATGTEFLIEYSTVAIGD